MRKRQPHWSRLESLIAECGRRGISALDRREVRELALLYRQTAADLSTARGDPSSAALARHLNDLLGRAHNLLYTAQPSNRHPIWDFYVRQFPAVFRECWPETALATVTFALGGLLGAALAATEPGFTRLLLGPEMLDTIERRQMWTHSLLAMKPLASSGIMANNLAVSFTAYATGIFAGLGPLYMMFFNGLLIGVIGLACFDVGMSTALWSFVAPHGALELPAIFIAGGAGFVLARGLLLPGALSRRDAMAVAGTRSIRLLLGVIPLLVIAGAIEGFISPTPIAPLFKFVIGGALFVLMALYLTVCGHPPRAHAVRPYI
jgi:uncharacterized membrane protein SpoIIM required for sporulation